MMNFSELWKYFKLLGDPDQLPKEQSAFLERFLAEQYQLREKKRIQYLMRSSGIKRVKLLNDFDWTFNPKIPRDKILEFLHTDWLKKPSLRVSAKPTSPPPSAMMPSSKATRRSSSPSLTSPPSSPELKTSIA